MPIVGKFFPSQKPEEKVFLLLRRHWFTYVAFLIIAVIMSIPLFVLLGYWLLNTLVFTPLLTNMAILGSSAYFLFIIALMLFGFVDYYLDVYIVTNERIVDIVQNGFFKRAISELHLHQVQDVNAQVKGFFPTLMHYGDIYIQTAGEQENFIFKSVPNPYRISKIIVDLHEAAIEAGIRAKETEVAKMVEKKAAKESKKENESDFALNLPTASLARQRTKHFLRGGKLVETEFTNKIADEINEKRSNRILNHINEDKWILPHNDSIKKSDKGNDSSEEGEMHENEEIDI